MNPDRWQQIDKLFHAALACEPTGRSDFLTQQCAGDDTLRHEVESLLSSLEQADDFIEKPAGDVAAELLGTHKSTFEPGEQIENYRIVRQLGSGGMGEVYLVEDTRLHRKVALKLLPPHFTINPDRVRRFEREARAASALNHPNIVTIYEIRQSGATHFIATEFVDGKTLRQIMNEQPLKLSEIINVTLQAADALSGAHAAGIVHRDIKPENIMIHRQGYVKVLDFGLAKLNEDQAMSSDLERPTLLQSNPGLVMGTVQYMAPEQARGKKVDARADVWSLGVVLYEMLAGRVPFEGETPSHVMVALMEDELPPLKRYAHVPDELNRIVVKTLSKNQKDRYQTAKQLGRDLRALKENLQLDQRSRHWLKEVPSEKLGNTLSFDQSQPSQAAGGSETASALPAQTTASVEYLTRAVFSYRPALVIALAVIVLASMIFAAYRWRWMDKPTPKAAVLFQPGDLIRVTTTGKIRDTAISGDGQYIGYVAEEKGRNEIHIRETVANKDSVVVATTQEIVYGLTFSPDSVYLYYTVKQPNNSIATLYRVTVSGTEREDLITDVDGPVSFSPDGKQFVFVRGSTTGERALIVASADGTNEHKIASRAGFGAFSFGGPAWSPDGKRIACGASFTDETGKFMTLVAVDPNDGSINTVTKDKWRLVGRVWWLNNGQGIMFSGAALQSGSASQLWVTSYPAGVSRRLTSDLQSYDGVSLTSDSSTLVTRERRALVKLWLIPNEDTTSPQEVLTNVGDQFQGDYTRSRFSWTPDSRIIYASQVNGTPNIWTVRPDGTEAQQLTRDAGANAFPSMSSDARHIVFISDRTGLTNVWRMNPDGTNQSQLTFGEDDSWAWCSPDAQWVVYHSGDKGKRTIHRIRISGGASEQLTDYTSLLPVVSPDGQWMSAYYRRQPKAPWQIAIIPFAGGPPVRTFDLPTDVVFQSLIRWTPDGRSLAYIRDLDGISNIWTLPIDGGSPKKLTDFKSDDIFWFDWSPDGQLAVSRGTTTSDVVIIRNTQRAEP
jgi:serine/threonine protein kinase/Tol biopolymer transport system component